MKLTILNIKCLYACIAVSKFRVLYWWCILDAHICAVPKHLKSNLLSKSYKRFFGVACRTPVHMHYTNITSIVHAM